MQIVGARFDGHADGGAARQTLLGIHAVGDYVHGVDGFDRRHVGGMLRKPDIGVAGSVDAGVIRALGGAIHFGDQVFLRIPYDGILTAWRSEARH